MSTNSVLIALALMILGIVSTIAAAWFVAAQMFGFFVFTVSAAVFSFVSAHVIVSRG